MEDKGTIYYALTLVRPPAPQAHPGGRREARHPQVQHLRLPRGLRDVDEGHQGTGGQLGRVRMLTRDIIHINSVGREDRGVYQCFVRNADDSAQASAELVLGETSIKSKILYSYRDSTFFFMRLFLQKKRTFASCPSVSFQCAASGTPLPQVTFCPWTADPCPDNDRVRVGDYVSRNGDVIVPCQHIHCSYREDGGLHSCVG
ncbi:down syndrome cell adhesion molecule-like protein Dscam2 [Caerostris extrusa]|uniref:Down syndrome cell adhesion molecule-like protein Dscam2 n=1 Tax=Caerostris extrusa TaxID=172846 RepID=A0AAV4QKB0_CAEEX|nr:down syndrome cell adhesion molecule-like protein Dscam2 [Caerostris extrusa]